MADWFGVKLVFSWWAAVLAAMVVSFPLMVRAIRLAFQAVESEGTVQGVPQRTHPRHFTRPGFD